MDPPDFIPDNFADIIDNLSDEDLEKILNMARQFTSESGNCENNADENPGFNFDPGMIFRLMNIFEKLNSCKNDPRCNLITALKPLLSAERRQKADTAVELIRLFTVFSSGNIFFPEQ